MTPPTKHIGRPRVDAEDDSVPVCVSLPSREYDDAYRRAQAAGVTVPEVIRRGFRRGVRQPPAKDDDA